MKTSTRLTLLSLVVVSSLAVADEPETVGGGEGMRRSGYLLDASPQERPMLLGIHAIVPYGYSYFGFGLGAGATFYVPLLKDVAFAEALTLNTGYRFTDYDTSGSVCPGSGKNRGNQGQRR